VPQVPLLFVVDGVKYQREQLPLLTVDRIYAIRVIKGRAALERYGREGSYGVVIIVTKQAAAPRA
jgi:outer membrane receptor for ferrienterochelin and colicin